MAVATKRVTAWMSEFVAAGTPPAAARERAATAVCDTVGVILAGAPEAASKIIRATARPTARGPVESSGPPSRRRRRCGTRERCGRPRARLRRHVLRVTRPSELRAGAGSSGRRGTGPGTGTRRARGVCRRVRDRMPAGRHHESAPLSSARLALHVVDRDDRRGGGSRSGSWTSSDSDGSRARHRRVSGLRPQGEHRLDGEAAARRHGRSKRGDGGAPRP